MVFQQTEFVLDAITSAFDKREPTSPIWKQVFKYPLLKTGGESRN
jgi:hypothetical protein